MEFHPEATSCGDGAMSPVLARLKSLKLELDMTNFLDGKWCDCVDNSEIEADGGRHNSVPIVHKLDTVLGKCSSLEELHISANRVFLGSERITSDYLLGSGSWRLKLQRLTLSGLFITFDLQRMISFHTPAMQAINFVDCYAPASKSITHLTWQVFFSLMQVAPLRSTLRALQVVNTRSIHQLEYARVVGKEYRLEIAEPEVGKPVEEQRTQDSEEWDLLQEIIARNVERREA